MSHSTFRFLSVVTHGAIALSAGTIVPADAAPIAVSSLLWGGESLLTPTDNPPGAQYGYAIALDANTAVIGAYGDDAVASNAGSAYVWLWSGPGWSQQAKLLASDGGPGDDFGCAVAVSGDTAVVGAYQDDDDGPNSGGAYVFVRDSQGGWSQQAKLLPTDGAAFANFGIAVAIDADSAVVGAHQDASNGSASGSAYVFVRNGNAWSQHQKLVPSDGAPLDLFGRALALDGNTLVVGAQRDDDMGTNSGSAYVFKRSAQGVWSQHAKLTAFDGAAEDNFGFSVSVSGDRLAVGAHQSDALAPDAGAAYVFAADSQGNWSLEQQITASDGALGDLFGRELSIDNDHLLVGAWSDDDLGADSGSAYVLWRDASNQWLAEQKLTASDGAADDFFGRAVAMAGARIVVGAHGKLGQNGGVYAFDGALVPSSGAGGSGASGGDGGGGASNSEGGYGGIGGADTGTGGQPNLGGGDSAGGSAGDSVGGSGAGSQLGGSGAEHARDNSSGVGAGGASSEGPNPWSEGDLEGSVACALVTAAPPSSTPWAWLLALAGALTARKWRRAARSFTRGQPATPRSRT